MSEKQKQYMRKKKREIVSEIERIFPDFEIYEDRMDQSEAKKYEDGQPHRFIIYRFQGFEVSDEEKAKNINHLFFVDIYTENDEHSDEYALTAIMALSAIKAVRLRDSNKIIARHASSDRYVDVHSLEFLEMIPYGC